MFAREKPARERVVGNKIHSVPATSGNQLRLDSAVYPDALTSSTSNWKGSQDGWAGPTQCIIHSPKDSRSHPTALDAEHDNVGHFERRIITESKAPDLPFLV